MARLSDIGRVLLGCVIAVAVGLFVLLRVSPRHAPPHPPPAAAPTPRGCAAPRFEGAAQANRASLTALSWTPFGPAENGWATYAPLVAHEVGTACPPQTQGFARDYAAWQFAQHRLADGVFRPEDFDTMRNTLALRRPFVQRTTQGICPAAADEAMLATAAPGETYGGKVVKLRRGVLDAYRRMVLAAHTAGVGLKPPALDLVSGFRGPAEEAARCADGGCDTLTRAHCSAHRTGLAVDLYLEPAPGQDPTSTADANRRHMAQTREYRWLVANAGRFGFLPYAYEPWHWEWTGEPP